MPEGKGSTGMGNWYRYDLMASLNFFAGINPKYCYAENSAAKTPDNCGYSNDPGARRGQFPENVTKNYKANVQHRKNQVIYQFRQNGSNEDPGRSLGSAS